VLSGPVGRKLASVLFLYHKKRMPYSNVHNDLGYGQARVGNRMILTLLAWTGNVEGLLGSWRKKQSQVGKKGLTHRYRGRQVGGVSVSTSFLPPCCCEMNSRRRNARVNKVSPGQSWKTANNVDGVLIRCLRVRRGSQGHKSPSQ
jgi:hypothetical protein